MVKGLHMEKIDRYKGCLVGGATGDALGWPVEFLSLVDINKKYGSKGIIDLRCNSNGICHKSHKSAVFFD